MVLNLLEIPIYYINLDDQPERNASITKRLSENGFAKENITRIPGIRKPGIPQDPVFVGCFYSQLKALKEGLSHGVPFMILEDDASINKIPDILDIPEKADALYVGISSWAFTPEATGNLATRERLITDRVNDKIVRVFNMLSSHAILYVNMEYVKSLIEVLEKNLSGTSIIAESAGTLLSYYNGVQLPVDIIMANQQYKGNVYALRDPIFYQDDVNKYCTLIKL
jgi:GR25 family glycosyltransferase involved in LPS biosynthesis